jgi:DNA (cytosine-5)-methyltransferase 1
MQTGEPLNELALFAGAGGGILGGHLLGWRTVCAVEWDAYAASVLVARQNDGCLPPFPVWDDVQTFDGRAWRGRVDVISGGFPCQDISAAGKGAGIDGERSGMWHHMARIIGEVRPRYAFVENSPMLTSRGLGRVLGDLAAMGYDARWGVLGAVDAGAPHKRERIWIVADAMPTRQRWEPRQAETQGDALADAPQLHRNGGNDHTGNCMVGKSLSESGDGGGQADVADTLRERSTAGSANQARGEEGDTGKSINRSADMGDTLRQRLSVAKSEPEKEWPENRTFKRPCIASTSWWATEPKVGRVAHGVAARVDRLRCLGNGQVPHAMVLAWITLCGRTEK